MAEEYWRYSVRVGGEERPQPRVRVEEFLAARACFGGAVPTVACVGVEERGQCIGNRRSDKRGNLLQLKRLKQGYFFWCGFGFVRLPKPVVSPCAAELGNRHPLSDPLPLSYLHREQRPKTPDPLPASPPRPPSRITASPGCDSENPP